MNGINADEERMGMSRVRDFALEFPYMPVDHPLAAIHPLKRGYAKP